MGYRSLEGCGDFYDFQSDSLTVEYERPEEPRPPLAELEYDQASRRWATAMNPEDFLNGERLGTGGEYARRPLTDLLDCTPSPIVTFLDDRQRLEELFPDKDERLLPARKAK